jgi:hypothetical protein
MNVEKMVETYIGLRDKRAVAKKEWEGVDKQYKMLLDKLEEKLKMALDEVGATSMKTEHGSFFKTYVTSAKVADFDALLDYIKQNDEWGLLERRVSKARVVELMSERADGTFANDPPPGVDFVRIEEVQVRRS